MPVRRNPESLVAALSAALLVGAVGSCDAPVPQNQDAGTLASGADSTAIQAGVDTPATPFRARPRDPDARFGGDLGIGVFHFSWHEDRPRDASADTIRVRRDPSSSAPILARFIYTFGAVTSPETTWAWAVESTEDSLVTNEVEFDYEEDGLPIDSIAGDWLRVIYAVNEAGEPRAGWTQRRQDTGVRLWRDFLQERNLFFLDDQKAAFYSSPSGTPVRLQLTDGANGLPDYTMHPEEVVGPWMRVRVVTPSDYCFDPVQPKRDTVWIRFLDARQRPTVFYHSRGC
jgi:hypothetical protein